MLVVWLVMEELFEEEAGEAAGMVADDGVFLEEIVEDDAEAQLLEGGKVDGDGLGPLEAVTPGHIGRHGLTIGDYPIDDAVRDVLLDGAEMIGKGVAGRFAGLGHQVGDVDARSMGFGDGAGNLRDEQIRKNAGVEGTGTEKNQVGFLDGFDGQGKRTDAARGKLESFDRHCAGSNAGLAVNDAAIFQRGDEMHVRKGGRKDAPADGEHFAADANRFSKVSGDVRESCEEKIAEIVADEAASRVKTILEQSAEKGFIFRKRHHAIADVAGREDAILAAQAAGAAAVIGDGDDGGKISDGALGAGVLVGAADDVVLEAAKQRGQSGAAAESDNPEASGQGFRFGGAFFHAGIWDGRTGFVLQKRI